MEIEINIDQLYHDLLEHFGTSQFWCSAHAPNRSWGPHYSSDPLMNRANGFTGDKIHNTYTDVSGILPKTTGIPIAAGALGSIDTMYEIGNYQGLVNLAQAEGFDLTNYMVT